MVEHFLGRFEAETCARPGVEALRDLFEVAACVNAQVDALGQILPHEAIGVSVLRTLPHAVRIAEIDLYKPLGNPPLLKTEWVRALAR